MDEDDIDVDICMRLSGLPAGGLECDLVVPLNLVDGKAGESIHDLQWVHTHIIISLYSVWR